MGMVTTNENDSDRMVLMLNLEDDLQNSISCLSTLPDPSNILMTDNSTLTTTTTTTQTTVDQHIWSCLPQLPPQEHEYDKMQPLSFLLNAGDAARATTFSDWEPWIVEWKRLGTILSHTTTTTTTATNCTKEEADNNNIVVSVSPFHVHAIAQQALLFFRTGSSSLFFAATCLLLCSHALGRCPSCWKNPPKFQKRWKSLLFETLHLYQRIFFLPQQQQPPPLKMVITPTWWQRIVVAVSVYCRYVLPNVWHVRQALLSTTMQKLKQQQKQEQDKHDIHLEAASLAAAVAIQSNLFAQVYYAKHNKNNNANENIDNDEKEMIVSLLLASINDVIQARWEIILCHPWRCRQIIRDKYPVPLLPDFCLDAQVSFWSCWRQQSIHSDSSDDDSNELEEDRAESVRFVDTVWNSFGIALIAAYTYHHSTPSSSLLTYRPLVWHPSYTWKLYFAHVPILLNTMDQSQESYENKIENDQDDDDDAFISIMQQQQRQHALAFALLRGLIESTPPNSLKLPAAVVVSLNQHDRQQRPLDPTVQTFQLLSNQLLSYSVNQCNATNKYNSDRGPLPDAATCYGYYIKQLIARHRPIHQVQLVQHLVATCPHKGLKPKWLDLLRNFVYWNDKEDDGKDNAQFAAWKYLDHLWGQTMETWRFPQQTEAEVAINDDPSGNSTAAAATTTTTTPLAWEKLVDQVEVCVSILSLVRLWHLIIGDGNNDDCRKPKLETLQVDSLETLQRLLQAMMRHWTMMMTSVKVTTRTTSSNSCQPDEYFRLNLLDLALEETIPLLRGAAR